MKFTRSTITTILVGALAIVIGVGWYFGLYAPLVAHIATTQTQVGVDQSQLANDRVQLAQLIDDKQQAPLLRAQLEALTLALPTTFSLASFISQADATASKAGVPLLQITPLQPGAAPSTGGSSATVPGVSSVAFTAEATGTFVALMHFCMVLIISENWSISRPSNYRRSLAVRATTPRSTFRLPAPCITTIRRV